MIMLVENMIYFSFTLHHHCVLAGGLFLCCCYSGILIDRFFCIWSDIDCHGTGEELALKHLPRSNIHRLCLNFVGQSVIRLPNFKIGSLKEVEKYVVNSSKHDHTSTGQIRSLPLFIGCLRHYFYRTLSLA